MKYIIDVPNQDYSYDKTLRTLKLKFYDDNLSCEVILDAEPYTEPNIYSHTDNPTGWELYQDYQKAKERYETWKKQMNEIHVGDEVENASHKKGIVLNHYISPNSGLEYVRVLYMDDDGNSFISAWEKNNVCKTGRHFDEVGELLKKIGSEE